MDTRARSQCSVAPEAVLNNGDLVLPPRISRVNGWSLPLHYFQVVTWAVFLGLSSATFGIFIPLLPHVWKYIAYMVSFSPWHGLSGRGAWRPCSGPGSGIWSMAAWRHQSPVLGQTMSPEPAGGPSGYWCSV